MFSQALLMSSLSLKVPKVANLFVILISYCFLASSSFSLLRLHLFTSNLCAAYLLTVNLSLTLQPPESDQYHSQLTLQDCTSSILECHRLSINRWSIWLWVFPSGEF